MVNFRCLGQRVALSKQMSKSRTAGGLFIPSGSIKELDTATVVAVGPAVSEEDVKVGDNVIVNKFSGSDIEIDNKKYVIVHIDDVLIVAN